MKRKHTKTSLTQQLQPVRQFVIHYKKFLFVMVVLMMVIFLVFRINQFSNIEPSQTTVDEQLKTVALPKLDQHILDAIQKLQDQNIEVRSLFDKARQNPFNE